MAKIPIKTRLPIEAWTVALIVVLYSLLSSAIHHLRSNTGTTSVAHARLLADGDPITTSSLH
jgi:hypothetical protein